MESEILEKLRQVTNEILTTESNIAIAKLRGILRQTTKNVLSSNGTLTANGDALSPAHAFNCINDTTRTREFIRATYEQIQILLETGKAPVHVLDAGSEPFSVTTLPLATQFKPSELQLSAIDFHEASTTQLSSTIEYFGLEQYYQYIGRADATTYVHTEHSDMPIDIAVSETMSSALYAEPQIAIMQNLAKQLSNIGVLLPQEIKVLCSLRTKRGDAFHNFGPVHIVNKEGLLNDKSIDVVHFEIEMPTIPEVSNVELDTKIQLSPNHNLGIDKSTITKSEHCQTVRPDDSGQTLSVTYKCGKPIGDTRIIFI